MSSLNVGSATGNPRNKVALAPGRSLMDWVRLCSSGKDMAGTKGALLNVTVDQLSTHNKKSDAWMAIRGIVYNVTEYITFHPGGEEELMRGVGTDATKLFNKIHPWVNYESLLKACIVGRLRTISSATGSEEWPNNIEKPISDRVSSLNLTLPANKTSNVSIFDNDEESPDTKSVFKMDWFQQASILSLIFYLKTNSTAVKPSPQVCVVLQSSKRILVSVEKEIDIFELTDDVRWPCQVRVHQTVVEIKLTKETAKLWNTYGRKVTDEPEESVTNIDYCKMKVVHVSPVSHDTNLIAIQYAEQILHYVHVGHHVQFKDIIDDNEVIRSYTPVVHLNKPSDPSFEEPTLYFLVKTYKTGIFSRKLYSSCVGDTLTMSSPRGTFNVMVFKKRLKLLLFAAGTGLTPMTSLITWTLNATRLNVQLIYFNKTEKDILWREEIDKLVAENLRFTATYVLSEASSSWSGKTGLISEAVTKEFVTGTPPKDLYVCVCGSKEFMNLCRTYVELCGLTDDDAHFFDG